jgi:hypothetical protein
MSGAIMNSEVYLTSTPLNGVPIFLSRFLPEDTPWLPWDGVYGARGFIVNEAMYKRLLTEIPPKLPEPHERTVARIMELLAPST